MRVQGRMDASQRRDPRLGSWRPAGAPGPPGPAPGAGGPLSAGRQASEGGDGSLKQFRDRRRHPRGPADVRPASGRGR